MNPLSPLASRLAELPELDPPPALRARIEAAWAARQRHRRLQRVGGMALAAGLALAALLLRLPGPTPDEGLAVLRDESRQLEQRLSTGALVHSGATLATELELQRVEAALQQAYDQGAAARDLAPLWRRRVDLLGVLLQLQQPEQQLSQI